MISWMPYLACSTIEYGSYPNGEEIVLKTTGPIISLAYAHLAGGT